ncbi:MAG: tRNA (cytidine(56)-2'-O)-methyltransferase [Nanohaloarchaea archaeon]|nr:tRNA (cytidine(56)-2'-O)-methyltransferase [Candidatus Nanohaloarchaea archaeon]
MIKVLRLGHRAGRDDRISTHVGLTARQWGADEIVYSGQHDSSMMQSVEDIVERWGGDFTVRYTEEWKKEIRDFEGLKFHLTMYGERIDDKIAEINDDLDEKDLMIIVGAEKVPRWVYTHVDLNISVGNQPHSEIAALAVFMDRVTEIKDSFEGAEIEVEPSEDRKLTEKK